jgi:hypothetical protein
MFFLTHFLPLPIMSLSSKPKKIKAKGTFRELKIVETVSRNGYNSIKTEEVKTPQSSATNGPFKSHPHQTSSSPTKRPRFELAADDCAPILLNLEGLDSASKRHTQVFAL